MDERHVSGHCDDRFAEVGEEFVRNLTERGDVGASVAVTVGGESVVDLWGGWMDADRTRAWEKATLCVAMSSTKGATSLCAHLLATTGELDFDRPVGLGPTCQSLVDATYRALGYRRRRYDLWVRG